MDEIGFVKSAKRVGACAFVLVKNWIQCVWVSSFLDKKILADVSSIKKARHAVQYLLSSAVFACLPQHATSQGIPSKKPDAPTASWQWAASDQSVLRVMAFDAARQQIAIKNGSEGVRLLKRGESVPALAVSLSEVYANSAVFRPVSASGKNSIDSISISNIDGRQSTSISFLNPPRRSVVEGWGRVK